MYILIHMLFFSLILCIQKGKFTLFSENTVDTFHDITVWSHKHKFVEINKKKLYTFEELATRNKNCVTVLPKRMASLNSC